MKTPASARDDLIAALREKLTQAEAALRVEQYKAKALARMLKSKSAALAQQGERIAQLVSALTAVRDAARQRYLPRDIQMIAENALAASSAEPPTPTFTTTTVDGPCLPAAHSLAIFGVEQTFDLPSSASGAQDEKENTK